MIDIYKFCLCNRCICSLFGSPPYMYRADFMSMIIFVIRGRKQSNMNIHIGADTGEKLGDCPPLSLFRGALPP